MAIWFGREICGRLEDAAAREWLVTNGIGGYACGTVAGHLTRAYHGLLVAAVAPPVGRSLLVTKFDETLTYQGQDYPLFTNQWGENTVEPHGYRYIEHFALSGRVPVWTYAVGEVQLQKRVWMAAGENTTAVQYSLTRGPAVDLSLKIIVNGRDHHGGTDPGDWPVIPVTQGVQVQPPGQPFYVLASQGELHIEPQWLQNYGLAVEHYRGTGDRDAHLQAAVLTVHLEPQSSVTLLATTKAIYQDQAWDGAALLAQRQEQDAAIVAQFKQASSTQGDRSIPTPGWITSLVQAADSFIVDRAAGEATGKT
ncbi:MAG: glycogen debranching enzyme N-terminal domain-containing protein, partial [Cyanobacteria bacterium P01_A01_bin.135]